MKRVAAFVAFAIAYMSAPIWAASALSEAELGLQMSLTSAVARARAVDELDPAYELVGIAGAAQHQGFERLAATASETFVDLVQRASKASMANGGNAAEDTLDQLVDLRFFARSTNILTVQVALDDALRRLFPFVAADMRSRISRAETWHEKLSLVGELGFLQAAATQVNLTDMANDMSAAFDGGMMELETFAAQSSNGERDRMTADIQTARHDRTAQVTEAMANNINVVAQEMESGVGRAAGGDRPLATAPQPAITVDEKDFAVTSCVEMTLEAAPANGGRDELVAECVVSGREPLSGRCPTANLSFVCLEQRGGGEQATYVYRGTPEEDLAKRVCGDGLVAGDMVPQSGVSFSNPGAQVAVSCAPALN